MSDIAYQRLVSETKTLGHITSLLMESRFRIFLTRNAMQPEDTDLLQLRGALTTVNDQLLAAHQIIAKAQTMLDDMNHIKYSREAQQAWEDEIEDCDPDGDRDYRGPSDNNDPCPACGNSLPLNAECRCSGCGNG